jgi:hypothetical protein
MFQHVTADDKSDGMSCQIGTRAEHGKMPQGIHVANMPIDAVISELHYFKGLGARGWGGRDRTSEWRNQNQLEYPMISRRIWKKSGKCPSILSIG